MKFILLLSLLLCRVEEKNIIGRVSSEDKIIDYFMNMLEIENIRLGSRNSMRIMEITGK